MRAEQLKAERQAAAEEKKRAAQAAREAKLAARSTGTQRFSAQSGTVGFKGTQMKRPTVSRNVVETDGASIDELREAYEKAVAKVEKAEKALNDPFSQVLPFVKAQREKNLERAEEAAEEARAALNRAQIGETGKLAAIALGAIGLVGAALLSIDTTESTSKTKSAASTKVKVRPSIKI